MTDVLGGGKFYVQTEEARVASIQKTLESLSLKDKPLPPGTFVPQKGDTVIAQFSRDDSWNRALVSAWGACMKFSKKISYTYMLIVEPIHEQYGL